jgi:Fe-S-cluster-containing dehydrogenase component
VVNCIAKARVFGDLNDPESEASKVLAKSTNRVFRIREDLGTEPNVYYLKAKGVNLK